MERRVGGGHMFDRLRCGEKYKSLIPCFKLIEIIKHGSLVICFVDVPAKNEKPLKL